MGNKTAPRPKVLPPMVSLRSLRQCHGLTLDQLRDKILEQGVEISRPQLSNAELGHRGVSAEVLAAWAGVFDLDPAKDVLTEDALRAMLCPEPPA